MTSLITTTKALRKTAENTRTLRLERGLTQEGLAERSGVSLATLRKFEQKGQISLESFFKLAMTLGRLEDLVEAVAPKAENFTSIDDVLKGKSEKKRQRGRHK
ncbi:MAG: helix-turn-helix transcriptional regulator [Bacteroidota bacterium]